MTLSYAKILSTAGCCSISATRYFLTLFFYWRSLATPQISLAVLSTTTIKEICLYMNSEAIQLLHYWRTVSMWSQPHAVKLCHLLLKLKRTHGSVSWFLPFKYNKRTAEMLGKPLTKLSAKGGFEQNTCYRRTGIKSNYKAQTLKTLEMVVGQRTLDRMGWQA